MTKALKVTITVYGAIGFLFGLAYLLFPRQAIAIQSSEGNPSAYLVGTKMVLGASIFAAGIFLMFAARDPIKHILWVKFAITFAVLFLAVALYSGFYLFADVRQALVGILIHGVATVALLAFYPWGTLRSGEYAPS